MWLAALTGGSHGSARLGAFPIVLRPRWRSIMTRFIWLQPTASKDTGRESSIRRTVERTGLTPSLACLCTPLRWIDPGDVLCMQEAVAAASIDRPMGGLAGLKSTSLWGRMLGKCLSYPTVLMRRL